MKKEEQILVAIYCLVYNHEPYLRDCFEGFVMQKTNFRFVAVVHDDCSTDESISIIREYTAKYPDIFIPIYETENQYSLHNGSIGRKMRATIAASGAKYVAMCEGDDYWTDPNKLQKQVDYMGSHPEVGLCYTDYNQQYDSNPNIIPSMYEKHHQYRPETYEQHLLKPGYLAPMTWLCRSEISDIIFKTKVYTDGTYSYMLEAMQHSKVAYIPETTATYRVHGGSASNPDNPQALFNYLNGTFSTRRYFADKYPCSDELRRKIMMRGYLSILPVAIMAEREDFVEEARQYMESEDMDIDLIIRELEQGEMKRKSKAYRIGKALLQPFKWLKHV